MEKRKKKRINFIIDCIWDGYWQDGNDMEEVKELFTPEELTEWIKENIIKKEEDKI